jgi:hypothetical protein
MPTVRTLIPRIYLLPTLAPLIWGLTLGLVVTLVNKVPHLMHLLQSSQYLAWQMSSLLVSLVIQIPVWLVVPTSLFIIVLCHHSLTHPSTPGQNHIGLHRMIMLRRMINRRQGLKLLWTPFSPFLLLIKGKKNWIKASRSILEGRRSRKNFQCVSSLLVRLVSSAFLVCLFQVGQIGLCNRSDRFVSFRTSVYNISLPSSLDLRKYCNMCYWIFYACLSSLCNPCVMQSISALLYL